jgi:hypothetical protein
MIPDNDNTIISEDGQRIVVQNGEITGTNDASPGLAYETGNVMDEKNEKEGGSCPVPGEKGENKGA